MYIEPMKMRLRDGRRIVLRSPEPEDAAADLSCMRQTAGETEFLLISPADVSADVNRHAAALEDVRDDPYQLLLLCLDGEEVVGRLYERGGYRIAMVHPQAVCLDDGRMMDEYLMIKRL